MNSKRKGSGGERELLDILLAHGIEAERHDQRFIGGRGNPDVSAVFADIPIHCEIKRTERLRLTEALNQAIRDADGAAFPCVIHRGNRQPWVVSFRLTDMFLWWGDLVGKREITCEP